MLLKYLYIIKNNYVDYYYYFMTYFNVDDRMRHQ